MLYRKTAQLLPTTTTTTNTMNKKKRDAEPDNILSMRDDLTYTPFRKIPINRDVEHGPAGSRNDIHTQLTDVYPTWDTIMRIKKYSSIILMVSGALGFIVSFLLHNTTTVLSRQVPGAGEEVGKLKHTPVSKQAGEISPVRSICMFALLIGLAGYAVTQDTVFVIYINQIRQSHVARITYYIAALQSTVIMLTILPMTGVINVYELIFASMLTLSEFMMYIYSDIINHQATNNWELYDASIDKIPDDPVATVARIKKNTTIITEFNYEPLTAGIVIHLVSYCVVIFHLIESLSATTYTIEPVYAFAVFATFFLQILIPVFKLFGMLRLPLTTTFYPYRVYILSVEVIECVTIELLICLLIVGLL